MSLSLKSKPLLSKSANMSIMSNGKSKNLRSEAKSLLRSSTLENIEIEYIKNLQQQVYFLELECNYLRQQLNLNGFQTSLKYDQKSQDLKNEMVNIQIEKNNLEETLQEQNAHNESVLNLLEQNEKNFYRERELLLKEISMLKNQKNEAEKNLLNTSVELSKTKENLDKHHIDAHHNNHQFSKIETQLENLRKDNIQLRAEINDSRAQLIIRDNLIKDLQQQLTDPSRKINVNELKSSLNNMSSKLSLTNEALTKEAIATSKLQDEVNRLQKEIETYKIKLNEINKENARLSSTLEISLKQNEADLLMAKKNGDISKLNIEKMNRELENEKIANADLKAQIEHFKLQERLEIKNQTLLKKRLKELEDSLMNNVVAHENSIKSLNDQHENHKSKLASDYSSLKLSHKSLESKINELNDSLDKHQLNHKINSESFKTKATLLQSQIEISETELKKEKEENHNLQLKIDHLHRQESIHSNLIASLKLKVSELEQQLNEFNHRENNFLKQIKEANEKINRLESENDQLKSEIDLQNTKLKEIERLKKLENLVSSQRWGDLATMAESMKSLSLTMSSTTGSSSKY